MLHLKRPHDMMQVSIRLCSELLWGCRCEGDTLKESLEYALEKFEDLSLYRDALEALSDAEWDTLKVNQSEWLVAELQRGRVLMDNNTGPWGSTAI